MATETTSAKGGYRAFSSSNTTLATAISDVFDELESHNISLSQTQFVLTNGGEATPVFTLIAICRR